MKKYQLRPSIRRRRIDKVFNYGPQHKVFSNVVNRKFKVQVPDRVYATDITYLQYGNGCRAYMSVMKDLGTKEVVHFKVFGQPNMELVMGGVDECLSAIPFKKRKKLLIHSDQGGHYTSKGYVHYYNNERPQWGLNGKTPKEYRTSLNVF